ncbi:MAG: hypothetical protein ACHQUC_01730 [Chlamydiales bacterium]
MKLKYIQFIYLFSLIIASTYADDSVIDKMEQLWSYPSHKQDKDFIPKREQLKHYYGDKNILLIASPGRSGSTLLTDVAKKYASRYKVLKTHLLPPDTRYKGKILFIFSNPDKAAESACHLLIGSRSGGATHFYNVQTADQDWFTKIGRDGKNQNETYNLLAYDALGYEKQLEEWLHVKAQSCDLQEAQILAIKYENLWDEETVQTIKKFLKIKSFNLPTKIIRGRAEEELFPQEMMFRQLYNVGTIEDPLYQAYDRARELWEQAPPFQFLQFVQ